MISFRNKITYLPVVNSFIKKQKFRRKYRNEIFLLKGKHITKNLNKSIIFYTVHKSASVYTGNIMKKLSEEKGMAIIDLDAYFFDMMREKEWISASRAWKRQIYKPFGCFYGPFRTFNTSISDHNAYQVLLVLRDPRDTVVSAYYSRRYSHAHPALANKIQKEKITLKREKYRQENIDDYALRVIESELRKYRLYYEKLIGKPNVLFLKYEDMVTNFTSWIGKVIDFFQFAPSQKILDEIMQKANFEVRKENIYAHKRQVKPGDHQRKLQPKTIKAINEKCSEILGLFDYAIGNE